MEDIPAEIAGLRSLTQIKTAEGKMLQLRHLNRIIPRIKPSSVCESYFLKLS